MSINEWNWMDEQKSKSNQNWVIVKGESVYTYSSFNEAVIVNQIIKGELMSESQYKRETE